MAVVKMDKQKVLIADDEAPIREILKIYCEKEGFDVIEAADGAEAILKVQSEKPDIIILDIMMPVLDGLEVCKQVRKMSDIPIIMLTAKDDDDDRILGLEIGADDYITKPFNNREVIARVKAVLRRSSAVKKDEAGGRSHIEYRGLSIDMEKYQVIAFGKKMTFTAKEMELLWCLASNPGKAFSRNQLLETIWGYSYYGELLTYLLMCLPMAVFSFVAWIRHPYQGNHAQVTVYRITRRDLGVMTVLTAAVTTLFYFLLSALHTVNLLPSTISVTTSFLAAYLTYKRSPYYALGYAANDVVLIILWVLASLSDPAYLSVVICFVVFLVNDLYAFFNWRQMERHQAAGAAAGGKEDASCSGI